MPPEGRCYTQEDTSKERQSPRHRDKIILAQVMPDEQQTDRQGGRDMMGQGKLLPTEVLVSFLLLVINILQNTRNYTTRLFWHDQTHRYRGTIDQN